MGKNEKSFPSHSTWKLGYDVFKFTYMLRYYYSVPDIPVSILPFEKKFSSLAVYVVKAIAASSKTWDKRKN